MAKLSANVAARFKSKNQEPSWIILDDKLMSGYFQAMKLANRRPNKRKVDLQSDSFSLSKAKTYLGRLMEKASQGETVYIVRGQRRFLLQEIPPIDPIPLRPPGYFANCYTKAELQEENRLAKASVIGAPKDLE